MQPSRTRTTWLRRSWYVVAGRHSDPFPVLTGTQWQALTIAVYILDMMFVKLSIGIFLLRLATQKAYVWTIRVALVIVTLWSLGIFFWNLFQCTPVPKQWDFRLNGTCAGPDQIIAAAYALSVMTVLSDWFFVSSHQLRDKSACLLSVHRG